MQFKSKYLINISTPPAQAAALTSHLSPVSPESRLLPAFNCFQSKENMIKAVKKLKFWPRKKKKRKTHHQPYCPHPPPQRPPPPPPRHYYYSFSSSSSSTQPSAPPLPPWLDTEYTYETPLAPPFQPAPEFSYHHHHDPVPSQQETAFNGGSSSTEYPYPIPTASYQQYTDPNPVYGVPVIQTQTQTPRATTKERCYAAASATRVLNCVVDWGIRLFHCICPCLHIREHPIV